MSKFAPLLLAYNDKQWIAEEKCQRDIWKVAENVEGVVIQNWKAIATWKYVLNETTIEFNIILFDKDYLINKVSLYEKCSEIANFRDCLHKGNYNNISV